jgi:hypothetical protein
MTGVAIFWMCVTFGILLGSLAFTFYINMKYGE